MAKEKAKIDNPFVTTGYAGAFDLYGERDLKAERKEGMGEVSRHYLVSTLIYLLI